MGSITLRVSLSLRCVFSGVCVLFPGGCGPPAPGVGGTRSGRRFPGLVPVPGAHLLSSLHDGGGAVSVGRAEPRPELPARQRLPRSLEHAKNTLRTCLEHA